MFGNSTADRERQWQQLEQEHQRLENVMVTSSVRGPRPMMGGPAPVVGEGTGFYAEFVFDQEGQRGYWREYVPVSGAMVIKTIEGVKTIHTAVQKFRSVKVEEGEHVREATGEYERGALIWSAQVG